MKKWRPNVGTMRTPRVSEHKDRTIPMWTGRTLLRTTQTQTTEDRWQRERYQMSQLKRTPDCPLALPLVAKQMEDSPSHQQVTQMLKRWTSQPLREHVAKLIL